MSRSSETAVELRVTLPEGVDLHARPAGIVARAAMGYAADVTVVHGDREADAKSETERFLHRGPYSLTSSGS